MPLPALVVALALALAPAAAPAQAQEEPDRWSWSGNARFRLEDTVRRPELADRFRARLRLRLAAAYRVVEGLELGGRLTTGDPDDPNSPYRDLGELFDRFPLSIDRLFLRWTPAPLPALRVTAGKFAHPFVTNPVYGELVWDADIQPEGAVVEYVRAAGNGELKLGGGAYLLLERGGAADARAWVAQASAEGRVAEAFGEVVRAGAAVGLYRYSDLGPAGADGLLGDNAGNATLDLDGDGRPERLASEFSILDAIATVGASLAGRPVELAAQLVHNARAVDDEATAVAAGGAWGAVRSSGDWRAWYQYQVVERDAVLSAFSQDDWPFQTDFRGHVFGVAVGVLEDVGLRAWALVGRPDRAPLESPGIGQAGGDAGPAGSDAASAAEALQHRWRLRLDLDFSF